MGSYDTVMVPCPSCRTESEFQSKSGECTLEIYKLEEAPGQVLLDVNRHSPNTCKKCGTRFEVDLKPVLTVKATPVVYEEHKEDPEEQED